MTRDYMKNTPSGVLVALLLQLYPWCGGHDRCYDQANLVAGGSGTLSLSTLLNHKEFLIRPVSLCVSVEEQCGERL